MDHVSVGPLFGPAWPFLDGQVADERLVASDAASRYRCCGELNGGKPGHPQTRWIGARSLPY